MTFVRYMKGSIMENRLTTFTHNWADKSHSDWTQAKQRPDSHFRSRWIRTKWSASSLRHELLQKSWQRIRSAPDLGSDGLGCRSYQLRLPLQCGSCGWKNCLECKLMIRCLATTKTIWHGIMAVHHETETKGLEHLPSTTNKPRENGLHTEGTRPCLCTRNSSCGL